MAGFRALLGAFSLAAVLGAPAAFAGALPFPLFDTQVHFYSNDFAKFPLHAEHAYMGQAKMQERATDHPVTAERVFESWKTEGVEAGVGIQYGAAYQADNRYLLSVAAQSGHRITPVVIMNVDDPASPALLKKLVTQDGVVGFRKLGWKAKDGSYPWLASAGMLNLWKEADALHAVVELMPYPRSPDPVFLNQVAQLADQFPHSKVVLDHFSWPNPDGAPDYGLTAPYQALAKHKNIYFKLTTENFERAHDDMSQIKGFVKRAVDVFGADHVMWGSDRGNTMIPYAKMVHDAIESTDLLRTQDRRQVLHDTGKKVFSITP
ncbi:amidohydrolase [mine drainage metagenome]|uniref:Amidohydrolase n=1 Tax=mine drainage metagenome TaxID=410659 RepID=A0A1J5S821_9ZZZZ